MTPPRGLLLFAAIVCFAIALVLGAAFAGLVDAGRATLLAIVMAMAGVLTLEYFKREER